MWTIRKVLEYHERQQRRDEKKYPSSGNDGCEHYRNANRDQQRQMLPFKSQWSRVHRRMHDSHQRYKTSGPTGGRVRRQVDYAERRQPGPGSVQIGRSECARQWAEVALAG